MADSKSYMLYAKESSKDQMEVLGSYAEANGLIVVDECMEAPYANGHKARPIFQKMLKRIEKGEAEGILCWSLDRLSSNPIDSGKLSWMLQQGVVKSIHTVDREYRSGRDDLLMALVLNVTPTRNN